MTSIIKDLAYCGYTRTFNGGGTHVYIKELPGGWTVSVCNGQACEPRDGDDRVHVNIHKTDDCENFMHGAWIHPVRLIDALRLFEQLADTLHPDQAEA